MYVQLVDPKKNKENYFPVLLNYKKSCPFIHSINWSFEPSYSMRMLFLKPKNLKYVKIDENRKLLKAKLRRIPS